MKHTIVETPGGEKLVLMSLADFEEMEDALDAAIANAALADLAAGRSETLTAQETQAALVASTPLAFWRGKRGLTQVALARAAGLSQSYLAELESGTAQGKPAQFRRLAEALKVRMEDLVVE